MPLIVQSPERDTAVIRLNIPRSEIRTVMGPAIREVYAALKAQKIAPNGSLFAHHFRMDPDFFDFEVGVPVEEPISATERVVPSKLPACTVARGFHIGPYEGLREAWIELSAWIHAEGHQPAADFWEVYLAGMEAGNDSALWRTELNRPLQMG